MAKQRATIYSVARELGIHASTVSRAFTRPDQVRAELLQRILAKAAELDYEPNLVARGLITGQMGTIGLLIPDIEDPYFVPVVRSIQRAAASMDLRILLMDSQLDLATERALMAQVRGQVDAFILVSPRSDTDRLLDESRGRPLVLVNRVMDAVSSAYVDNTRALAEAGDHLLSLGHRRIALLRGPSTSWAATERRESVMAWGRDRTVEVVEIGPIEALFEGGVVAADAIVASKATAVIAFDDLMACGAIAGLAQLGVAVPRDVSLVGIDDVLLARMVTPALTTIRAPYEELGGWVMESIRRQVGGQQPEPLGVFQGELVVRASTAPPRA